MRFFSKNFLINFSLVLFAVVSEPSTSFAKSTKTINFTPNELRTLAGHAVVSGQTVQGYEMATALLQQNPNDTGALTIRARAARDLGRFPEAIATARRAWGLSQTPSERFGSSMVMAQALFSNGAKTRAQLWLRRAAEKAPNEELKQVAVRNFHYAQRTNPWSTNINISAAPNSNINNGSARATTRLFDSFSEFQLTGTARALSGIQYNVGVATRYRMFESERSQHDLILRLDHKAHTLSKEAQLLAPNAKGSDFNFSFADLSYIRRGFSSAGARLPNQLAITGGYTWYANAPFMQYARISFTQNYAFAPGIVAFAGVSREFQQSLSTRQDADSWSLNAGVRFGMANQDQLTLSILAKKSESVGSNLDYDQVTLSARYALARPIAGVSVDFGIFVGQKDHEQSSFTSFGRHDKTLSADITGVFRNLEYFGFSPSVTLSGRRSTSNIGRYESQEFGLRVGIQSAF